MGRAFPVGLERRRIVAAVSGGLVYAFLASRTRPFTVAADVVTAVPLAAAVAGTAWWVRTHHRHDPVRAAQEGTDGARPNRSWIFWTGSIVAVAAWEIYCYAHLPRVEHPTLSALIDILDSSSGGKTVGFAAWLALGWFLVTR